jgi:hypothetical protein
MIGGRIFTIGETLISLSYGPLEELLQRAIAVARRRRLAAREQVGDERFHVLTLDVCDRLRHAVANKERAEEAQGLAVRLDRLGRLVLCQQRAAEGLGERGVVGRNRVRREGARHESPP